MIFVTLGTQDKPFKRLIKAVEKQVILGNIKQEVIVQVGCTKYKTNLENIKIVQYMTIEEFNKNLEEAEIVITHAGAGTIIQALEKNKKVIVAARKKVYGEHVNNHQEQILENFSNGGYVLPLKSFRKLNETIEQAEKFKTKKIESNAEKFIKSIENEISNLLQ